MGELDRVEEDEITNPKAFNSFPEALLYVRRLQSDQDESLCIVSKGDGQFEVVPFVQGLQLIDNAGYRLIFAY